jgi:hypothetical protein
MEVGRLLVVAAWDIETSPCNSGRTVLIAHPPTCTRPLPRLLFVLGPSVGPLPGSTCTIYGPGMVLSILCSTFTVLLYHGYAVLYDGGPIVQHN